MAPQGNASLVCRRMGHGKAYAQNGVGTEARLVGGAVERHQALIDLSLAVYVHATNGIKDVAIDSVEGLQHTLAVKARAIAIAQLHCFVGSRRGA